MFKIAFRNILRNKRRTIFTGSTIMFAVMVVIYIWSFLTGVIDGAFENSIRTSSGHIRILDPEYVRREKMLPLEANISGYKKVLKIAEENEEVILATGRIKFGVLLEHKGRNKPVRGLGVDPAVENQISNLGQHIVEGRKIEMGREEMNIGDKLAKKMGIKLGDTLTIVTQTAYGSLTAMNLRVVGIVRFGIPSFDGTTFYMPFDKSQELLDLEGKATEIFIIVKDPDNVKKPAAEINAALNNKDKYTVKTWQDTGMLFQYMSLAKKIYASVYVIILLLASFTIFNTMYMAVLERTREIGMMKALGMKNRQIMKMVIYEALLIGVIASLIGAVWGSGIAYFLNTVGLDFTAVFDKMGGTFNFPVSYVYKGAFSLFIITMGFFLGVIFTLMAAIPPAIKASKMQPTDALRTL